MIQQASLTGEALRQIQGALHELGEWFEEAGPGSKEKETPTEKAAVKVADALVAAQQFADKVAEKGDQAWEEPLTVAPPAPAGAAPVSERARARRMALPNKNDYIRCVRRVQGERPDVEDPGTICALVHFLGLTKQ